MLAAAEVGLVAGEAFVEFNRGPHFVFLWNSTV
jgi:hypothetical protein